MRSPVSKLDLAWIEQSPAGMVTGTLRILPLPDRRGEVLEALRSIQEPALAQPGCMAYHVYEEQGPERAIVLVQRWDSEAAIGTHIRSDLYDRVLGAIELSSRPPEIAFDHVVVSEGIEFIERARVAFGGPIANREVRGLALDPDVRGV